MEELIYQSINSEEYKEDIKKLYHIYFDLFTMNELRLSSTDNAGGKLLKYLTLYEEHLLLTEKITNYYEKLEDSNLLDDKTVEAKKQISEILDPKGDNYSLMGYLQSFLNKVDNLEDVLGSKDGLDKYRSWTYQLSNSQYPSTKDILNSYYQYVK